MAIYIIATLEPKNGGSFPIAKAKDIQMPDGSRLSEYDASQQARITDLLEAALKGAQASGVFNGPSGKTPVKGVDYFTEADKAEMVEEVAKSVTVTASTPVFDLAAMGLQAVPMDGSYVFLSGDFTAVCAALDAGAVKLIISVNMGVPVTVEFFSAAIKMGSQYMCTYTADLEGAAYLLYVRVEASRLVAKIAPFDVYIGNYINEALGGDY